MNNNSNNNNAPFILLFTLLLTLPLIILFAPNILPPKHVIISQTDESDDVTLFQRAISGSVKRLGSTNAKPKIAFLFLTNTDLVFAPLWNKFFEDQQKYYNVYVHADPDCYVKPPGGVFENRFIAAKKTQRSSPTLISAARRLLAAAVLDDPLNSYFALVSQHCVPLHSFGYVYNTLFQFHPKPSERVDSVKQPSETNRIGETGKTETSKPSRLSEKRLRGPSRLSRKQTSEVSRLSKKRPSGTSRLSRKQKSELSRLSEKRPSGTSRLSGKQTSDLSRLSERQLSGRRRLSFIEVLSEEPQLWDRYIARGKNVMLPEIPFDKFRIGSQFYILTREHALTVIKDRKLWRKFRLPCLNVDSCYPEEHYFPTLLSMEDPKGVSEYTLTNVNWTGSVDGHPYMYSAEEVSADLIRRLRVSNSSFSYLFGRKFSPECLVPLMEIADNVIFRE